MVSAGPVWTAGMTVDLVVDRVEERPDRPRVTVSTPVTVEVIDADEQGWTFLWSSESSEIGGLGIDVETFLATAPPEEAELLDRVLDGPLVSPELSYRVLRDGRFAGFEGVDLLRAELAEQVSSLGEIIGQDELVAQLLSFYDALEDGELVASFAPALLLYHYLDGAQLVVGEQRVFDDEFPSVLDGRALPAVTEIEVVSLRGDSDDCVVYQETSTYDSEDASDIIADSVVEFFGATPGDADEMRELLDDVEMTDRFVGHVDATTGAVRRIETEFAFRSPEGDAVDRLTIRDVTGR